MSQEQKNKTPCHAELGSASIRKEDNVPNDFRIKSDITTQKRG